MLVPFVGEMWVVLGGMQQIERGMHACKGQLLISSSLKAQDVILSTRKSLASWMVKMSEMLKYLYLHDNHFKKQIILPYPHKLSQILVSYCDVHTLKLGDKSEDYEFQTFTSTC
jgi:hypothetical protein